MSKRFLKIATYHHITVTELTTYLSWLPRLPLSDRAPASLAPSTHSQLQEDNHTCYLGKVSRGFIQSVIGIHTVTDKDIMLNLFMNCIFSTDTDVESGSPAISAPPPFYLKSKVLVVK